MKQKRRVAFHQALLKPILLAGGERELVIINVTIACALVFGVGMNFLTVICAFLLLIIGQGALMIIAKADPLMSKVYKRHISYQAYYPARSSRLARTPLVKCLEKH